MYIQKETFYSHSTKNSFAIIRGKEFLFDGGKVCISWDQEIWTRSKTERKLYFINSKMSLSIYRTTCTVYDFFQSILISFSYTTYKFYSYKSVCTTLAFYFSLIKINNSFRGRCSQYMIKYKANISLSTAAVKLLQDGHILEQVAQRGFFFILHLLRFSRPDWTKPRATWSDLRADPVLSRKLEERPPEVASILNYSGSMS